MERELAVFRDVQARLQALDEARRLRAETESALVHLRTAKQLAAASPDGSTVEQHHLQEAADASRRLAALRAGLVRVEAELRRSEYLLRILSNGG